jgi:hypothetical protein
MYSERLSSILSSFRSKSSRNTKNGSVFAVKGSDNSGR